MKRHGDLWPQVISFEALLRAAEQACKGKRFRPGVAAFHFDLEPELWKRHEELSTKTYRPGAYRTFVICEPKPRQISAAPYRDRVVHHVLVNVLEPISERTFIQDSYACRTAAWSTAWPSARTGSAWRPAVPTTPSASGTWPRATRWPSCAATTTMSKRSRSAPTGYG